MSKKKAPKKKVTPKPAKAPKPKQTQMFDSALPALEKLAHEYAENRDQRMEYGKIEVQIKGELLAEMKKLGKDSYVRDGIEIRVVKEEESVKVRIKEEKDSEE